MVELSILKSFLTRENYTLYRNYLSESNLPKDILPVLRGIDLWYKNNTDDPSLEDIANLTFAAGVPEKEQELIRGFLTGIGKADGSRSVKTLLERFKTERICTDLSLAAYDASRGSKSVLEVLELAGKLSVEQPDEISYVTDDLETILDDTVRVPGLRWRLNCLNRSLGSLRKGDFGFVFARPETGKTTFLASEVTHMAGQLGEDSGPVLWFNNEEQGKKVKLRCFEAALSATKARLLAETARAKAEYTKRTGNKIKIIDDDQTISRGFVESVCAKEKPSLILFDQIDKIKGFKADREDLAMGAIYQWSRELAKKYSPVIGVCQADGTAEGEAWLHMGHVANAKTAKQAEADFILGIGKKHDPGLEFVRFINISKNKLIGDQDTMPGLRHSKLEVLIEPEIGRYKDIG